MTQQMMMMITTYICLLWLSCRVKFSNCLSSNRLSLPHSRKLQSFSTSIAKLTASNGAPNDDFGDLNQLSISKNRIIVGAYGFNGNRGAAYLYGDPTNPESGHSYSQLAILTAVGGVSGDFFGDSASIKGDTVLVGAPGESGKGAVYVYRILVNKSNAITISLAAKLTASDGAAGDQFGNAVASHRNIILVGARRVDSNKGAAYLFVNLSKNPDTSPQWTELQKLKPTDLVPSKWFGYTLAITEHIAVIGTFDFGGIGGEYAAHVFAPDNPSSLSSSWTRTDKLIGPANSDFGAAVAVAEHQIVVGAFGDDNSKGIDAGAVFIFTKTSSAWTQMTQLLAADGAANDNFGRSVAVSKDGRTIAVGADFVDFSASITDSGAAYLFQTTDSSMVWTQMEKFIAADRAKDDRLGLTIAMENNIVVVGAPVDEVDTGSVYVIQTGPDPLPAKTFCFSAANTVWVKGKGVIPMHALEVGDLVQTSNHQEQSLSRVLSFMHMNRDAEVEYLQIFMENKEFPLEVSHDHFLIKETNMNVVRAQDIKVGDMLLSGNKVARISTVERRGLFAPVTESGTIVVSGVTASCYVGLLSAVEPMFQARASHVALTPLRIMCAWQFSLCQNESYSVDGYSFNMLPMTKFGVHLYTWNGVLQWLVVILLSPALIGFLMLEIFTTKSLLLCATAASVAGGFCFYGYKATEKTM